MKKAIVVLAITATALLGFPTGAVAETSVTVGAGGIYPSGTSFNGVPISGLQSGYGVNIDDAGSALGQFCTVLLGVSALGSPQNITIYGKATGGSRSGVNVATFSGTCTIDMGNGTPPILGVPFTVTITTNTSDQGTVGLLLGQSTLPAATVNEGSMTIR